MSKWIHRLSLIDTEKKMGICDFCGVVKLVKKQKTWRCSIALKKWVTSKLYGYKKHKKDICDRCGFISVDICQMDVDHIDGNHWNNNEDNLQTLCANCHRLKTRENNDYKKNTN